MAATSPQSSSGPGEHQVAVPVSGRIFLFVAGLVAIAIGVFVIADTKRTLDIVAVLFGIYLLIWALVALHRSRAIQDSVGRAVWVLIGLVGIAAGVLVIIHPTGSLEAVAWAFGIYLIAAGVVSFVHTVGRREQFMGIRALAALIDLAAGIVLVAWPGLGLKTVALIVGIYLIVRGVVNLGISLTGQLPART